MTSVIGVTGTNGKTSTALFLRQILSAAGLRAVAMTSLGLDAARGREPVPHLPTSRHVGRAYISQLLAAGYDYIIVEAASEALARGEFDEVSFDMAALTSFGTDHLDFHASEEDYRRAKARLFDLVVSGGVVVWSAPFPAWGEVTSAGLRVVTPTARPRPFAAPFLNDNVATATEVALRLLVPEDQVLEAVRDVKPPPGRMEHVGSTRGAELYVDYAHNASGLRAVLTAARELSRARVLLAFGCGGDRDVLKRGQMGSVAAELSDVVIVTDDNPRLEDPAAIRRAIVTSCPQAIEIPDRERAVQALVEMAGPGDVVVVAGRGHEDTSERGGHRFDLSDRELLRASISRYTS